MFISDKNLKKKKRERKLDKKKYYLYAKVSPQQYASDDKFALLHRRHNFS